MSPKVSFVTGVKNRAGELQEMIRTILKQDFNDWEAIVVDDHSSENVEKIISETKDPRIRYYKLPAGKTGISAARNFAIKLTQSNFIIVADSDDLNEPFRARMTYNAMKKTKCDVFYGNIRSFKPGKRSYGSRFQPFNENLLKMMNFIPNPASAFRKDTFVKIGGYDSELLVSEDYDLWIRLSQADAKFCYTKKVLVNYRRDNRSLSRKKSALVHQYVQKVREKNGIKPLNVNDIRNFAKKGIAKIALSKKGIKVWQDDRYTNQAERSI